MKRKRVNACYFCNKLHRKCDGSRPCGNCIKFNKDCIERIPKKNLDKQLDQINIEIERGSERNADVLKISNLLNPLMEEREESICSEEKLMNNELILHDEHPKDDHREYKMIVQQNKYLLNKNSSLEIENERLKNEIEELKSQQFNYSKFISPLFEKEVMMFIFSFPKLDSLDQFTIRSAKIDEISYSIENFFGMKKTSILGKTFSQFAYAQPNAIQSNRADVKKNFFQY